MKKYVALVLTMITIAACFTACGKKIKIPKVQGAEVVTDQIGAFYPVATEKDGSVTRNAKGEIELIVTNENGKAMKDGNGNYVKEPADLSKGIIIGRRVEYTDFSIFIPDGWMCACTLGTCAFKRTSEEHYEKNPDETYDCINFTASNKNINELIKQGNEMQNAVYETYAGVVTHNTDITIKGQDCPMISSFVPDNGHGVSAYLANIYFEAPSGRCYSFTVTSERDLTNEPKTFTDVLDQIEYYN